MPYPNQIPDFMMAEIQARITFPDDATRVLETPAGESVFDRTNATTGIAGASQQLNLGGFTARVTQTISSIRVWSASTAAAATPTLVRLGVYLRDTSNNYTLVASTPNDTALFAAASTTYNKAFSAPFVKTAGADYLVGVLVVTGVALPTYTAPILGNGTTAYLTDNALAAPVQSAKLTGQADLPSSFTGASLVVNATLFHAFLLV